MARLAGVLSRKAVCVLITHLLFIIAPIQRCACYVGVIVSRNGTDWIDEEAGRRVTW